MFFFSEDCFKQLKQRVIWKFDGESLHDMPSNVMIRKWLPQNDIFAHRNIVLFISHGGVFGSVESLWHGVPMLMTALFADQHRNSRRGERAGYAKFLPFFDITNETLKYSVDELLTNKSYLRRAQEVSSIFKANVVPPMEDAMFWIEYVCQFRGADHLKSYAVHMSWFSYLLIDVLSVTLISVFGLLYVIYTAFRWCCCKPKYANDEKKQN